MGIFSSLVFFLYFLELLENLWWGIYVVYEHYLWYIEVSYVFCFPSFYLYLPAYFDVGLYPVIFLVIIASFISPGWCGVGDDIPAVYLSRCLDY